MGFQENLLRVQAQVVQSATAAGRVPEEVAILAVSKGQPIAALLEAVAAGQRDFGENYLQEAEAKMENLATVAHLRWHFIGSLQRNKSRTVAEKFDWVHSLDRMELAQRLSEQRPAGMAPLQVCLQVNLSGEASKGGCSEEAALPLALKISQLPALKLRGFMTMPAPDQPAQARHCYQRMKHLLQQARQQGLEVDTLSMGMSDDFSLAISEGATIIRVGTLLFGPRAAPRSRP